ncbi:hypothetical protein [Alysiella crassa]|uniref:Uncharacterized protein n=1 Tax=Alysiella crassa TaxID=153491 RepID=A0A376BW14_9NEIS|nr:hypothetical protein [Alysiella crassa]UOP06466.1 hypothetical protein LVJ80_11985 [Alysiella crassa]SSY80998.1 Uncharacterised protein [Alysiella crassa]
MLFIKSQKLDFQEKVLQPFSQRYRIQSKHFASEKPAKKSRNKQPENAHSSENAFEKQIYISEYEGWIRFQAAAQYPDKLINVNSPELHVSVNEQG